MSLAIWTIYRYPSDFPTSYIARKWVSGVPTHDIFRGESLEDIREKIPEGLYCLPREAGDDPVIVETWF